MGLSKECQRQKRRRDRPVGFYPEPIKKKKVKVKKKCSSPVKKKKAISLKRIQEINNTKAKATTSIIAKKYRCELIKKATHSEKILKRMLDEGMVRYKFQEIITYDNDKKFYIVDFLIGRLVIELDGKHHYVGAQLAKDIVRDKTLRKKMYKIIRIPNSDMYTSQEEVKITLKSFGVSFR